MGLFSILRHKMLCISAFKEILHCEAICDVKSGIDPCLSDHGRGSKLLLVLITLRYFSGRKKNMFAFGGEIYIVD